jgi:WD40 repeat protein
MKRVASNPTNVSLFEEPIVLRQSFGFLDHKDMRTCRLICQLWRETLFTVPNFLTYYFSKTEVIKGKSSQESYEIFTRLVNGNCFLRKYDPHHVNIASVLAQNGRIFSSSQSGAMGYFDLKNTDQDIPLKSCQTDDDAVEAITIFRNQYLAGVAYQTLWIWNFENGKATSYPFSDNPSYPGVSYNLSNVVSYNEKLILSGLKVVDNKAVGAQLFVWDVDTKKSTNLYFWIGPKKEKRKITALKLDENKLACGCEDGTIILIDLKEPQNTIAKKINLTAISSLATCDDFLISCDSGGYVKVTNRSSLEIIQDHPLPKAMNNERMAQLTAWNKMILSISHMTIETHRHKSQTFHQCKLWNLDGHFLPIKQFSFPILTLSRDIFKAVEVDQDNLIMPKEDLIIALNFNRDKQISEVDSASSMLDSLILND